MDEPKLTRNQILELKDLARKSSLRNTKHKVIVEGTRSILGAIRTKAKVLTLIETVQQESKLSGVNADRYIVDQSVIEKIATTSSPQNAIAICQMPVYEIQDIQLIEKPIFVLDNVSDPGNVGTIIRSCAAFDIGAVILIGGCDPWNPKVVRSSAGTVFGCPVLQAENYQLEQLLANRTIYAADLEGKTELGDTKFSTNPAVVFGNEANGIISPFFEKNTKKFAIDMAELCESLNVAMSATVVAHHLAKIDSSRGQSR